MVEYLRVFRHVGFFDLGGIIPWNIEPPAGHQALKQLVRAVTGNH